MIEIFELWKYYIVFSNRQVKSCHIKLWETSKQIRVPYLLRDNIYNSLRILFKSYWWIVSWDTYIVYYDFNLLIKNYDKIINI